MKNTIKTLALLAIVAVVAFPQATVNLFDGPPSPGWTKFNKYDASSNLEYICYADPNDRRTKTWTQGTDLTSIVDASNTSTVTFGSAHGLIIGHPITIAGVTTDTDLNGVYIIQTVPSTTTFTITTADVGDATYTDSGTTVTTTAPRTADTIWIIQRLQYDSTTGLVESLQWARGSVASKAFTAGRKFSCDSASSYVYE